MQLIEEPRQITCVLFAISYQTALEIVRERNMDPPPKFAKIAWDLYNDYVSTFVASVKCNEMNIEEPCFALLTLESWILLTKKENRNKDLSFEKCINKVKWYLCTLSVSWFWSRGSHKIIWSLIVYWILNTLLKTFWIYHKPRMMLELAYDISMR